MHPAPEITTLSAELKVFVTAILSLLLLSSCTALKSLHLTDAKKPVTTTAPAPKNEVKFIDNITVSNPPAATPKTEQSVPAKSPERSVPAGPSMSIEEYRLSKELEENRVVAEMMANRPADVENASPLQLKYSILLNTYVEQLRNQALLAGVDEWYGVRYRRGGMNKTGVDCSGFVYSVYAAVYGIALPRVSHEQYRVSRRISTTELQEGDLIFFSTQGRGVSHVGIYLQNNKFIHASVSHGVMVSDLFEPYYIQRYVGAGRIDNKQVVASTPVSNNGGR